MRSLARFCADPAPHLCSYKRGKKKKSTSASQVRLLPAGGPLLTAAPATSAPRPQLGLSARLRPDPLLSREDFGEPGPASGGPSSPSHLSRNRGAERKARGSWKGKRIEAVQTFPRSVKLGGRPGVGVRVAVAGGGGDPRGGAALGRVQLQGSQAQEAERPWSLSPAPSPRKLPFQLTSLRDHSPTPPRTRLFFEGKGSPSPPSFPPPLCSLPSSPARPGCSVGGLSRLGGRGQRRSLAGAATAGRRRAPGLLSRAERAAPAERTELHLPLRTLQCLLRVCRPDNHRSDRLHTSLRISAETRGPGQ